MRLNAGRQRIRCYRWIARDKLDPNPELRSHFPRSTQRASAHDAGQGRPLFGRSVQSGGSNGASREWTLQPRHVLLKPSDAGWPSRSVPPFGFHSLTPPPFLSLSSELDSYQQRPLSTSHNLSSSCNSGDTLNTEKQIDRILDFFGEPKGEKIGKRQRTRRCSQYGYSELLLDLRRRNALTRG